MEAVRWQLAIDKHMRDILLNHARLYETLSEEPEEKEASSVS